MATELTKQQKIALDWHLENNVTDSTPTNIEIVRNKILSDPISLKNIVSTYDNHLASEARSKELRQKLAVQFGIGSKPSGQTI